MYSSVFAIFTESLFVNYIIDWKLFYAIILINYILLFKIKKITFNKYFVGFLLFFFIHGIVCYSIILIPPNYMLSQILGITVIGTYYYNLIPLYNKEDIAKVYLNTCLFVAVIGYPMYFLDINVNDGRLQSIFKEPAHYVVVVIPACYYYLKTKKYLAFTIIFGTLILSSSSLGYIGCGLMFLIPNITLKRLKYFIALVPIAIIIFTYVYNNYEFFKLRVDDTYKSLNVINTGKFDSETNLSSYILIGNMFIANKNIQDHPFGSGIGSHHYMHSQYIKKMRVPPYLIIWGHKYDNSTDANSMFTRICSEFGIIGFGMILLGLFYSFKAFHSNNLFLAQGIFVYILLKLFRDGHYFAPELYFFVWMLYYYIRDNQKLKLSL